MAFGWPEQDGVIHGSIAIDGSHYETSGRASALVHYLRRFTWPGHRLAVADGGAGVLRGNAATGRCTCGRLKGCWRPGICMRNMALTLAQSQPGSQWGKEVTEQLFIKKIGL